MSTLTRVGLTGGRMHWLTGEELQISESGLRSADFTMTHIKNGNFVNCEAIELDFAGALLENTRWFKTTMSNAQLPQRAAAELSVSVDRAVWRLL